MKPFAYLKSLLPRRQGAFAPVAPDTAFCVIGDIHGCDDKLARALERVPKGVPLVCVGDYIDRGPASAGVLRRLMARQDTFCLRGNHEEMMMEFLEAPAEGGAHWLHKGGQQTLESFGVPMPGPTDAEIRAAADALRRAMGDDLLEWLYARPLMYRNGNVVVVHAAMDPDRPVGDQLHRHLTWGHPNFLKTRRRDGLWVVHGHTVIKPAAARSGRISVDTGAFAGGSLTLAYIAPGAVRFMSV